MGSKIFTGRTIVPHTILAFLLATACTVAKAGGLEDGATYKISEGKAYKVEQCLPTNEWVPLTDDDYVDDYVNSEKAKVIADANARLKRIRNN